MSEPVRVLLVSGSTRDGSGNTAALVTVAAVAPSRVTAVLYGGLTRLPPFNPDDDGDHLPWEPARLRVLRPIPRREASSQARTCPPFGAAVGCGQISASAARIWTFCAPASRPRHGVCPLSPARTRG